jgi:hypothetical protein
VSALPTWGEILGQAFNKGGIIAAGELAIQAPPGSTSETPVSPFSPINYSPTFVSGSMPSLPDLSGGGGGSDSSSLYLILGLLAVAGVVLYMVLK